jgi:hypothetical protein
MNKILSSLIISLSICLLPVYAEQKAKISAETQKLLDAIDKAIGGKEKITKITSAEMDAEMEITGQNLTFSLHTKVEMNKIYIKTIMAGQEFNTQGYNGEVAWSKDMISGLIELKGEERYSLLVSTLKSIYYPQNFYDEITSKTKQKFDKKDVYHITYKKGGMHDRVYIVDSKTHLIIAQKSTEVSAHGSMKAITRLDKYVKSNMGVLYPQVMNIEAGPMKIKATITTYKENVKINADIFNKPEK